LRGLVRRLDSLREVRVATPAGKGLGASDPAFRIAR
jgi:hypothetical protein